MTYEMSEDKCRMADGGSWSAASALLAAVVVAVFALAGCWSENMGSKTIVGNHYSLPKVSQEDANVDCEVYESTEGAVVYTRRDCEVEIAYTNVYTNHILGIWDKAGFMKLGVKITPCEVAPTVDARYNDAAKTAADALGTAASSANTLKDAAAKVAELIAEPAKTETAEPAAEPAKTDAEPEKTEPDPKTGTAAPSAGANATAQAAEAATTGAASDAK